MPTAKKTPWFPMSAKPSRPGVYELRGSGKDWGWTVWTGDAFNGAWSGADYAGTHRTGFRYPVFNEALPHCLGCSSSATGWRGLRNEAKES